MCQDFIPTSSPLRLCNSNLTVCPSCLPWLSVSPSSLDHPLPLSPGDGLVTQDWVLNFIFSFMILLRCRVSFVNKMYNI